MERMSNKKENNKKETNKKKKATKKKINKMNNKKITIDNIEFDSKMEAQYYVYLKKQQKEGKIKGFVMQPSYKLLDAYIIVNGETIPETDERYKKYKNSKDKELDSRKTIYTADFLITHNNGEEEIIEVKGFETPEFSLRRKMFNLRYPNKRLTLVRQYRGQWVDLEKHKIRRAQRRRDRTFAKKRKLKDRIRKDIQKIINGKLEKEKFYKDLKKIKGLTEKEKDKTIEIYLRENKLPKDYL